MIKDELKRSNVIGPAGDTGVRGSISRQDSSKNKRDGAPSTPGEK